MAMLFVQDNKNCPIIQIRSACGLRGIVALADSAGHVFSKEDWIACLARLEELDREPQQFLKRDGAEFQ